MEVFKLIADSVNSRFMSETTLAALYDSIETRYQVPREVVQTIETITFARNCIRITKLKAESMHMSGRDRFFSRRYSRMGIDS